MYSTKIKRLIPGAAAILLLLIGSLLPLGAQSDTILTVKHVLQMMEKKLQTIPAFEGQYQLKNGEFTSNGKILYKKPFFLRMVSQSDGSMIISNGKTLWVYLPRYGVVAEQELIKSEKQYQILLSTGKKSLRHLKRDYSFQFAPGGKNDEENYILDLRPRVTKIGFKKIRIWVNRETGLIQKVESVTINNKEVNITFSNIEIKQEMESDIFWFGIPDGNIQVIKNTILPENNQRR